jgi:hypothetical protein
VANLNIGNKEEIYLRLEENYICKSKINELLPDNLIATEQTRQPLEDDRINHIILLTYREAVNESLQFIY